MLSNVCYNYRGEDISGTVPRLRDASFGVLDKEGNPVYFTNGCPLVKWPDESDIVDKDGFDQTVGTNYRHDMVLPKNTHLCRYGSPTGRFTTLAGTPYSSLSLPYIPETLEYHEYIVTGDNVHADAGLVGKAFNSDGGGIQFLHNYSIQEEISRGNLREIA